VRKETTMPQSAVALDIANKDDAKQLIEVFLGHDRTAKIEITKANGGYQGVFTTEDPPAAAAGAGT
jgi:hypothetical protein